MVNHGRFASFLPCGGRWCAQFAGDWTCWSVGMGQQFPRASGKWQRRGLTSVLCIWKWHWHWRPPFFLGWLIASLQHGRVKCMFNPQVIHTTWVDCWWLNVFLFDVLLHSNHLVIHFVSLCNCSPVSFATFIFDYICNCNARCCDSNVSFCDTSYFDIR